ncbi:hypothetical protein H04402_0625A [Clostridium botulinum H04402 065]|nr:hypothetical protein H04402_0625A [Clostridium botulinum H04402 065]
MNVLSVDYAIPYFLHTCAFVKSLFNSSIISIFCSKVYFLLPIFSNLHVDTVILSCSLYYVEYPYEVRKLTPTYFQRYI